MCNYISRIDEGLQNEFIKLRFNQLPEKEIEQFLNKIVLQEKINISQDSVSLIQQLYKSDIRSMINFIQLNQYLNTTNVNIIQETIWEELFDLILKKKSLHELEEYVSNVSLIYNLNKKNIIKDFFNFIIRKKQYLLSTHFLDFVENIVHSNDSNHIYYVNYVLTQLLDFISTL